MTGGQVDHLLAMPGKPADIELLGGRHIVGTVSAVEVSDRRCRLEVNADGATFACWWQS